MPQPWGNFGDAQIREPGSAPIDYTGRASDAMVEPTAAEPEEPTLHDGGSMRAPPPMPSHVGRHVVTRVLGHGGMAVVYAAYDPELDRRVAIKVLRSAVRDRRFSVGQARLQREAQTLARLSHPNVVQVYAVGRLGDSVFTAMELVVGMTLRTWLEGQQRSWREVLRVFLAAGEGLAAAHAVGIVHRDFKPDNVLVGDDGRVRVADFGLARLDEAGDSGDSARSGDRPRSGDAAGSGPRPVDPLMTG